MMKTLHLALLLSFLGLGAFSTTLSAASAQSAAPRAAARPTDERSFVVYPNPSNGVVHISISGFEGRKMELRILNVIGTVIYRETITELTGSKTLDLSKFASGLYYVKLEADNASQMRKLVIR